MRGLLALALAAAGSLVGMTVAAPIVIVHPEGAEHIIITANNTVNATQPAPINSTSTNTTFDATTKLGLAEDVKVMEDATAGTAQLPLKLVNNFPGGAINAYVTGLDSNSELVMLQPDGSFYYPTCDSSTGVPQSVTADTAIPLGGYGSTTTITLPGFISAARVWFANGDLQFFTVCSASGDPSLVEPSATNPTDPSANINWGFVELTNTDGGLYANISYVDFVGLVLGMSMVAGDGSTQTAQGLVADAVSIICSALEARAKVDGQPWGDLCMADSDGTPLRVIAPSDYVAANPDAFSGYFDDYINDVWDYFTSNTLTIDTQGAAGEVGCTVQNGELTCDGDNRGYAQPTAGDIFGCNSGTFAIADTDNDVHSAIVPRLCAAFDRTTLMLDGGNMQPGVASSDYYNGAPTNWYSAYVHENEVDNKGYAFSYDDVNPAGENESGVVSDAAPQSLTIIVGGPLSS